MISDYETNINNTIIYDKSSLSGNTYKEREKEIMNALTHTCALASIWVSAGERPRVFTQK